MMHNPALDGAPSFIGPATNSPATTTTRLFVFLGAIVTITTNVREGQVDCGSSPID